MAVVRAVIDPSPTTRVPATQSLVQQLPDQATGHRRADKFEDHPRYEPEDCPEPEPVNRELDPGFPFEPQKRPETGAEYRRRQPTDAADDGAVHQAVRTAPSAEPADESPTDDAAGDGGNPA